MRILYAEDERSLSMAVHEILKMEGYEVDAVYDGEEALEHIRTKAYDAAILDIMMPKADGIQVLAQMRAQGDFTPVLLLTAKAAVEDRITGLSAVADDYLGKPFSTGELLARLNSMICRSTSYKHAVQTAGNITLDCESGELKSDTSSLRLSSKESQLLSLFLKNKTDQFTAQQLCERLWKDALDERIVVLYISYLQDKLTQIHASVNILRQGGHLPAGGSACVMKKLRHKLICMAFLVVSGVFVIVLVILYVSYGLYYSHQADAMTQLISGNGGIVPEFQEYKNRNDQEDSLYPIILDEESEFRTRYFIVYLVEDAQTVSLNIKHIASVSESEASEMAQTVISGDKTTGYLDSYRYRVTQNDNTYTVIFLDCNENFTSRTVTMRIIALTAILIIVLITFLFGLFSKRVVQPFEENANRQKQFITDASNELKTPLSIISANAEVLEYKNGKNDWTQNIIAQSQRMGKLIGYLLTLSQMDEVEAETPKKPVNFSLIAVETASSF